LVSLRIYIALLIAVGACVVVMAILALSASGTDFSDRLVEAGDWLAGGTLALAAVAGLVAVQAYAAATGLPRLEIQMRLSAGNLDASKVEVTQRFDGEPAQVDFGPGSTRMLRISLKNLSGYSAQNPALVVRLKAMAVGFQTNPPGQGWMSINSGDGGVTELQWDGGPTYSIHGYSTRHISLAFRSLTYFPESGEPSLDLELLAEGYRRAFNLPVQLVLRGTADRIVGREPNPALARWV
jgi:hypothetical protein